LCNRNKKHAGRNLRGRPENKRRTEKPRLRCGGNTKIYIKETGLEVVDWVH
jgi:hypothetical protein